jgi:uncharacterized protein YutE (UPF0331/DUF86 family)
VLFVRNQLPDIARSLKSIKYKDFEMTFEREIKEAAAEVKEALSAWDAAAKPGFSFESISSQHTTSISHYSQSAAMLEAWLKVETSAAELAVRLKPDSASKYPSPLRLREILTSSGILNRRQAKAFDALRKVRNRLVHAGNVQFSEDAVAEYLASAESMAMYIAEQTRMLP